MGSVERRVVQIIILMHTFVYLLAIAELLVKLRGPLTPDWNRHQNVPIVGCICRTVYVYKMMSDSTVAVSWRSSSHQLWVVVRGWVVLDAAVTCVVGRLYRRQAAEVASSSCEALRRDVEVLAVQPSSSDHWCRLPTPSRRWTQSTRPGEYRGKYRGNQETAAVTPRYR